MQSSQVPDIDKSFIRSLKQDWTKSSQLFSHNINQKSIRTFVKNGQIRFEPKAATAEFQEKRMNMDPFFTKIIPLADGIHAFDELGLDLETLTHHPKSAMKIVMKIQ